MATQHENLLLLSVPEAKRLVVAFTRANKRVQADLIERAVSVCEIDLDDGAASEPLQEPTPIIPLTAALASQALKALTPFFDRKNVGFASAKDRLVWELAALAVDLQLFTENITLQAFESGFAAPLREETL